MTDAEFEKMRQVVSRGVGDAKFPENYVAAKAALRRYIRAEKCATWPDKETELAFYSKVAEESDDLIAMARRIRVRAIRECSKLFSEYQAEKEKRKAGV